MQWLLTMKTNPTPSPPSPRAALPSKFLTRSPIPPLRPAPNRKLIPFFPPTSWLLQACTFKLCFQKPTEGGGGWGVKRATPDTPHTQKWLQYSFKGQSHTVALFIIENKIIYDHRSNINKLGFTQLKPNCILKWIFLTDVCIFGFFTNLNT